MTCKNETSSIISNVVKTDGTTGTLGTVTITAKDELTGTNYGYVRLYAEDGTENPSISKQIEVKIIEKSVVTMKNGTTKVATSNDTETKSTTLGSSSLTLSASVETTTGKEEAIVWATTDSSVASVKPSSSGATAEISPRGSGSATITATANGETASYLVVVGSVESLTITKKDSTTEISEADIESTTGQLQLSATVKPTSLQNYITWTINDTNVLKFVDSKNKEVTTTSGKDVTLKAQGKTGKATVTATVGGKSKSLTVTVWETAKKIKSVVQRSDYTIRDGADLVARFQKKYPTVLATLEDNTSVEVPIIWLYSEADKDKDVVHFYGRLNMADDSEFAKYELSDSADPSAKSPIADAKLTTEGEVTSNVITASKTNAVAGDKVTFTCKAAAEPSDCTLSYQWYKNGTPISGATGASYTFTVPEASVDSNTTYQFTCGATATRNNVKSTELTSNTVTLNVSRDYSIDLTLDKSSAAYTVGQMPKVTATVYKYSGSTKTAVSNVTGMSWELLDASTEKALSSNIATISGSGNSATITTKAANSASGQKITVQATVSLNGYTYSTKKEITLSAASVGTLTMAAGSGAAIKATTLKSKVSAVVNSSNVTLSYVKFGTPKNCTLTKSSGSSSAIGSTACYFSTTSGQKLSDVYVTLANGASTGSVSYTVYDNNDNTVATGTINFDSSSTGSITCLGIDFADANAAELIAEEFPEAEYVKFNALDVKYGRLLLGYKGIVEIDSAKDVKDSDKYYLKNSSSVDGVEELYLLPRTDYYGAISISYTAYSSSKALGEGTLTFTVVRKTASSKFTDVTSANVGSWAADAIDFMADNSLVGGVGNNKFNPTGTMTRCDLVLIMYRMAGQPSVTGVENPFTDVNTNDYFYKAVLWAYKNGVVNGTGADTFSPKKNITREQIASILFRYSGATTASGSLTSFTDAGSVSDYATTAMKWAVGAGIIGGSNGKLDPQGNATRAQVAVMLHRFLNK